jgi:hypothetical protein
LHRIVWRAGAERLIQKPSCLDPVAPYGSDGNVKCFSCLLLGHPAKEPALDDPSESFVELRELIECFV